MPSLPRILRHLFTRDDDDSNPFARTQSKQSSEGKEADPMEDEASNLSERSDDSKSQVKKEDQQDDTATVDELDEKETLKEETPDTGNELQEDIETKPQTNGDNKHSPRKPRYAGTDNPDPESRYLDLDVADKLEILLFLCDMNLSSKVVRNYIDDCDLRLTEERKDKAELNKQRKELYVIIGSRRLLD